MKWFGFLYGLRFVFGVIPDFCCYVLATRARCSLLHWRGVGVGGALHDTCDGNSSVGLRLVTVFSVYVDFLVRRMKPFSLFTSWLLSVAAGYRQANYRFRVMHSRLPVLVFPALCPHHNNGEHRTTHFSFTIESDADA